MSEKVLGKISRIKHVLKNAFLKDQLWAFHLINKIEKADNFLSDKKLSEQIFKIEKRVEKSIFFRMKRVANLPILSKYPDLPIIKKKTEIISAIQNNQVVIISGATGSGKTTQIPKFCLEAGCGIEGSIVCTQPRRIAAVTISKRLAYELNDKEGRIVGYKIRFKDTTFKNSYIKIVTDGILLAQTQNDANLYEYDTIIIDEAHERSLNIDFLLGFLKKLLKKREELKLIITSATIDTEKFSKAFDNAPVIEVSGSTYPVDLIYYHKKGNVSDTGTDDNDAGYIDLAVDAVFKLLSESISGDILVFMPTEHDILETCRLIEARASVEKGNLIVLPLFARLAAHVQLKIFSTGKRKVVVSTNIAETSITIPGIRYVVDTGLARIPVYFPGSQITSLAVVFISKSSMDQRKGRCGRLGHGVCVRLFPESDYNTQFLYTPPEILRANLAEVILRMIALKLGDIRNFPFVDMPKESSIKDGVNILYELGAIDSNIYRKNKKEGVSLTKRGHLMAKMPVDPRLSRMLMEADQLGCVKETAVIAAVLSIKDPRQRPLLHVDHADLAHKQFLDPDSDFITFLNIWNCYYLKKDAPKSNGDKKRFCRKNFLSYKGMGEWKDVFDQIITIVKESGFDISKRVNQFPVKKGYKFGSLYIAIHRSILTGYLSNIGQKKEKEIYNAAKGRKAMVFPGSSVFKRSGQWIVSAEMVMTSKLFAKTVANIDSTWIEDAGGFLCKRSYIDPHWEKNREDVVAYEQVSLFGLIIISKRPVSYGRINRKDAADIFLRSAIVNSDVKEPLAFMVQNQKLIDGVVSVEDKIRCRDILVSEDELLSFYKQRLENIYDLRTLKKIIRQKGDDFLKMEENDITNYYPKEETLNLFPDKIKIGETVLNCDYKFNILDAADGVTVKIPDHLISPDCIKSTEWLIPGFYKEKIFAILKGFPKEYRKKLVPISKKVDEILKKMPRQEHLSLNHAVGQFIQKEYGIDIPGSVLTKVELSNHLKMRFSVTDYVGKEIKVSRNINDLNVFIKEDGKEAEFKKIRKKWELDNLVEWNFVDLPESVQVKTTKKKSWYLYPGLEKNKGNVNLRLFKNRAYAMNAHKDGILTLLSVYLKKDLKNLKKELKLSGDMEKYSKYFGGKKNIETMLFNCVKKDLFYRDLRSSKAFYNTAKEVNSLIQKKGQALLSKVSCVIFAYHETRCSIYQVEQSVKTKKIYYDIIKGIRNDLERLIPENFITLYSFERLKHLPRYIQAIKTRILRLENDFEKDQAKACKVKVFQEGLNTLIKELSDTTSKEKRDGLEDFFWFIEEFKVSLFAQELKTPFPVSEKRLKTVFSKIRLMV